MMVVEIENILQIPISGEGEGCPNQAGLMKK